MYVCMNTYIVCGGMGRYCMYVCVNGCVWGWFLCVYRCGCVCVCVCVGGGSAYVNVLTKKKKQYIS